jgi:hypothetical protein
MPPLAPEPGVVLRAVNWPTGPLDDLTVLALAPAGTAAAEFLSSALVLAFRCAADVVRTGGLLVALFCASDCSSWLRGVVPACGCKGLRDSLLRAVLSWFSFLVDFGVEAVVARFDALFGD